MDKDFKNKVVKFLFHNQVMLLGDFLTKSNRRTPYFFNIGQLHHGKILKKFGDLYAELILSAVDSGDLPSSPSVIFGPAYKGIPLSLATVLAMGSKGCEVAYAFDRKEVKDHGDKGNTIGKPLAPDEKVIIIDDVITSGISIAQTIKKIQDMFSCQVIGAVVAVDRLEPFNNSLTGEHYSITTAKEYLAKEFSIPVLSMVTIAEILTLGAESKLIDETNCQRIKEYLNQVNKKS